MGSPAGKPHTFLLPAADRLRRNPTRSCLLPDCPAVLCRGRIHHSCCEVTSKEEYGPRPLQKRLGGVSQGGKEIGALGRSGEPPGEDYELQVWRGRARQLPCPTGIRFNSV